MLIDWAQQGQLILQHLQKEKAYKNKSGIYHFTQFAKIILRHL